MFTKVLILVLLGSTFVVCSPQEERRLFRRRDGKPGPIRRGVQRALNFTVNQAHRARRVVKGAAKETLGVGKDIKDLVYGKVGDVARLATEGWGTIKNGTIDTVHDIAAAIGDIKERTFETPGTSGSLGQCILIPKAEMF